MFVISYRDMNDRAEETTIQGPFDTQDEARSAIEAMVEEIYGDEEVRPHFEWAGPTLYWDQDGTDVFQIHELNAPIR